MFIGDLIRGNTDKIVDVIENKNTHVREYVTDGISDPHTDKGTVSITEGNRNIDIISLTPLQPHIFNIKLV
jgi:hypothetical protein